MYDFYGYRTYKNRVLYSTFRVGYLPNYKSEFYFIMNYDTISAKANLINYKGFFIV